MRFFLSIFLAAASASASAEPALNQIQVIGSHNSYHIASPPELLAKIVGVNPGAKSWGYTHPPLLRQLESGVRQFELDIFADSKGGLFASPHAMKLVGEKESESIPHKPELLSKPGFKVLHIPDIDCWSNAPTLILALREMFEWSGRNPSHLPIMILVECKDQKDKTSPTVPETLTRALLMDLEKEILSVIPADRILKPDDVRGGKATLREGVITQGWPAVGLLRGKFIFALDNTDGTRDLYLEGNPSLEGRLLFVSAPSSADPAAAWFKCNDPIREQQKIRDLVKAGFLVRTRADTNMPDPEMRKMSFESGAQWISTDYFDTGAEYHAVFDGNRLARSNPMFGLNADIAP